MDCLGFWLASLEHCVDVTSRVVSYHELFAQIPQHVHDLSSLSQNLVSSYFVEEMVFYL